MESASKIFIHLFHSLVRCARSLVFTLHRNSRTKFDISRVCTVGQTQLPDKFQVFYRKRDNRQSGLGWIASFEVKKLWRTKERTIQTTERSKSQDV